MKNVETVPAKRLLTPVRGSGNHFFRSDYTLNLYRGCNHGCIYCDSRSECYHIDRFDSVRVKENALWMLKDELSRKREGGVICMGAASDPYNALEKELQITRGALRLMLSYHFGVGMSTKSALIARDAELLSEIGVGMPTWTAFSITTANDALARLLEPRASSSRDRFEAMEKLAARGVMTGTWMNPMLPFLTDSEKNLREVIRLTKESGGRYVICFFGLTLRTGDREYFYQALNREPAFNGVKDRYVNRYGLDYECPVPAARELYGLFERECASAGLYCRFEELNAAMAEKCPEQLSMF